MNGDKVFGQSDTKDTLIRLHKWRERVHSSRTRTAYKRVRLYPENYTTSDDYEDSRPVDVRLYGKVLLTLTNIDAANSLTYTILGCIDPRDWQTLKAATALAAAAQNFEYISESWAFVKVQVKSTGAGSAAKPVFFMGMKSH